MSDRSRLFSFLNVTHPTFPPFLVSSCDRGSRRNRKQPWLSLFRHFPAPYLQLSNQCLCTSRHVSHVHALPNHLLSCHSNRSSKSFAGAMASFISPDWFIAQQVTQHGEGMVASSEGARLVALQLGNAYFLLCMLGVAIVSSTSEPKVVRKYLVALWLGDIGHVGITCLVLGPARFTDLGTWNALTWGNIGATVRNCFCCLWTGMAMALGLCKEPRESGLRVFREDTWRVLMFEITGLPVRD